MLSCATSTLEIRQESTCLKTYSHIIKHLSDHDYSKKVEDLSILELLGLQFWSVINSVQLYAHFTYHLPHMYY